MKEKIKREIRRIGLSALVPLIFWGVFLGLSSFIVWGNPHTNPEVVRGSSVAIFVCVYLWTLISGWVKDSGRN